MAALLSGRGAAPDIEYVKQLVAAARERAWNQVITSQDQAAVALLTFHARQLAVVTQSAATDALVASRTVDARGDRAGPAQVVPLGRHRRGSRARGAPAPHGRGGRAPRQPAVGVVVNSLRGALALAAAVATADLTGVQHGFWVALGTLSVLRTSATSTGATALRALAGTAAGFVIGSVLVLAIGSDTALLWAMLPVSVCAAAYCSGQGWFETGQAAFTVLVAVLFNLLVLVGWRVGVVRVEDVALGCLVSVVIGALLWPRGVVGVVADDLADAFRQGGSYLSESMNWTLGRSAVRPASGLQTESASLRLDGALRALLAEQGTKQIPQEHLWRLVGAAMRLRLTAHALARTPACPGRVRGCR